MRCANRIGNDFSFTFQEELDGQTQTENERKQQKAEEKKQLVPARVVVVEEKTK